MLSLLISANSFGFQEVKSKPVNTNERKKEKAKIKSESARIRANEKIEAESKKNSTINEKKQE
jgi:hypothetical protein